MATTPRRLKDPLILRLAQALSVALLLGLGAPGPARAAEVYRDGDRTLELGLWTQGWYQYVQDATGGEAELDQDLHDLLVRRVYLSVKGGATPWLGFFIHFAGDRFGQQGLDNPGSGLGTGLALRDGWIAVKLLEGQVNLHVGRMYIPFTRNYGTTSTKALLTTDLDWTQGGYRGGIFYPSRVGRDDGATLWGNLADGHLQYRLMVADGVDDESIVAAANPRLAGRLSASLFDTETSWFNKGNYLGERRVLSIGIGGDHHPGLATDTSKGDYLAWTADLHLDQPIGDGALALEASYIDVRNAPNAVGFTVITPGSDLDTVSAKGGYLIPGQLGPTRLQPFVHHEWIRVGSTDTNVSGAGANLFFAGHGNKLSVAAASVWSSSESLQDHIVVTVQLAAGI